LYIIVGVDPGTTTAIAAFDLRGRFLGAWSGREAGKEEVVRRINAFGTPALIATDVSVVPDLVARLASDYNTRLFSPAQNLTIREKLELARGFDYENEHELDAIAAARRACHAYENKFRLIERVLEEKGLAEKTEEVKQLVISGLSVHRALLLLEPKPSGIQAPAPRGTGIMSEKERVLRRELECALRSVMELKKALGRLEAERRALLERLAEHERGLAERMRENAEIRKLQMRINVLEDIIRKMRAGKRHGSQEAKKNLKQPVMKEKTVDIEGLVSTYRQSR